MTKFYQGNGLNKTLLKLSTHYQCPWAVITGRVHGPWSRVSRMTPVITGRWHGPCTRCQKMTPGCTGRWHGRHFGHPCSRPWTRPVITDREHG